MGKSYRDKKRAKCHLKRLVREPYNPCECNKREISCKECRGCSFNSPPTDIRREENRRQRTKQNQALRTDIEVPAFKINSDRM
jgi:hypothetical protein